MGDNHGKGNGRSDTKQSLEPEAESRTEIFSVPVVNGEENGEDAERLEGVSSEILVLPTGEQPLPISEATATTSSAIDEGENEEECAVPAVMLIKEPETAGETETVDTVKELPPTPEDIEEVSDELHVVEETVDPQSKVECGVRQRTAKSAEILEPIVKKGDIKEENHFEGSGNEPDVAESVDSALKYREQPLADAFALWFFLAAASAVVAGVGLLICRALFVDQRAEFLTMPPMVREHYSKGQIVKIAGPDRTSLDIFVRSAGPSAGEVVVCLHGLASSSFTFRDVLPLLARKKMRALALDLSGSGLSDKPGVPVYAVHNQVQSLTKALASLALPPVHLVAHDTGALVAAAYAANHPNLVRSLTFVDTPMVPPFHGAFPIWPLNKKLSSQLVASSPYAMWHILRRCCSNRISQEAAEAHAYLLRVNGGLEAASMALQQTNSSAAFADTLYKSAEGVLSAMAKQILWSGKWSSAWEEQGEEMAAHWPMAEWHTHEGGRWPQEDVPDQLADLISKFIFSLPKTIWHAPKEEIPDHIQRQFDAMKAQGGGDASHHHGPGCNH